MGILDKIKDMISVTDGDFDEDTELASDSSNIAFDDSESEDRPVRRSYFKPQNQPAAEPQHTAAQMHVVLVKPERFEEAPSIADHLNARRTVVLNLEVASKETSRRLLDFLSGAAYIKNGDIKKVANSTYIITPCNVDFTGELISDDIDAGGNLYF